MDTFMNITVEQVIEFLGTFAFAISGIRHAAEKTFDWFGGYVCGIAVAIGGGTIRDVMLGTTPFWMTSPFYMLCTALALVVVVVFSRWIERLKNAWFVFDTLGLALCGNTEERGVRAALLGGDYHGMYHGCRGRSYTRHHAREGTGDIPQGDLRHGERDRRNRILADDTLGQQCGAVGDNQLHGDMRN